MQNMMVDKTPDAISMGSALEKVLVGGNLSELNSEQRVVYYKKLCDSLGLNPLTKPFEYITLQGKLTLYARKDATEQLRKIHGISIVKLDREVIEGGVCLVTAYAKTLSGREDIATGAVSIAGLKGEALANALMKAESKAKRRVTLSVGGLGMLDETEIETIPEEQKKVNEPTIINSEESEWFAKIAKCMTLDALKQVYDEVKRAKVIESNQVLYRAIIRSIERKKQELEKIADEVE